MTGQRLLPLVLALAATSIRGAGPTITIDAASPVGKVSPLLYGLMTEEINHSYDGGLYAELVQNRAFLDDKTAPVHWTLVQGGGTAATMALDPSQPLNQVIGTSLRLEVTKAAPGHEAGIANEGYWGIPVRNKAVYRASFFAKAAPGFTGPIMVSMQSEDGLVTYASATLHGVTAAWKQYEVTLVPETVATPTAKARYALTTNQPGTIWFSLVSLFPPTFRNQANGFRPRPAADARGHEAEVSPFPRRQLSRGGSDRRSLRVEEDARRAVGSSWPPGAVGLPVERRTRPL